MGLLSLFLNGNAMRRNFAIFFTFDSRLAHPGYGLSVRAPIPLAVELRILHRPFSLLPYVSRVSSSGMSFVTSLFSFHNLWTIGVELLLLSPFAWLVSILRKPANFLARRK